jgi:hypothetical protein
MLHSNFYSNFPNIKGILMRKSEGETPVEGLAEKGEKYYKES